MKQSFALPLLATPASLHRDPASHVRTPGVAPHAFSAAPAGVKFVASGYPCAGSSAATAFAATAASGSKRADISTKRSRTMNWATRPLGERGGRSG